MKAGSFDLDTCKEVVGDERCRTIESDARAAADTGRVEPLFKIPGGEEYFAKVQREMEKIIWLMAYQKRAERIRRITNDS